MYSTYEAPSFGEPEDESQPSDRKKVVILGGGPNRIGQGIEFDYCCVHAAYALDGGRLRDDHGQLQSGDGLDRLRHVGPALFRAADRRGRARDPPCRGVARHASWRHRPVRRADSAEARRRRSRTRASRSSAPRPTRSTSPRTASASPRWSTGSACRQPLNGIARSRDEAIAVAERIGYPVLTRPSYVLGGRAMEIVDGPAQLDDYIHTAVQVSGDSPVLIDQYLRDAIEVDVDAICDGTDVVIAGVMQHIEEAGVHSRRQRLLAAALQPRAADRRRDRAAGPGAGPGARRGRADERPVRGQGRRRLSDRGQSARQPHRAVRRQGDRHADRQDRGAGDGRREAGRFPADPRATSPISRSRRRSSRSRASRASIRSCHRK